MAEFAVETLHPAFTTSLRIDRLIYDSRTEHQRILIFENEIFGRAMTLDGVIQVTEGDEFIYHEMLTHLPVFAHGGVRRALIVGGGDGGIARELLRHAAIEAVTLVDIDRGVIDLTRAHMPALWGGAADDPRLSIVIDDGAAFVRRADAGPYDLIIVDSTDPVGPAETLFTDHFYAHARARLSPGGVLVTQNGVAFLQGAQLASTLRAFGALFHDAACYLATIPTYTGGPMAFGWGADGDARFTPHETIAERVARAGLRLRYYSPEVHAAAFVLPPYVAERLERSAHVLQRRTGPHGSHPS